MFPSNGQKVYTEFIFSLFAVFAIATFQSIENQLWPFAFMILFVVVYSGKYGRVDLTMSNTLARWLVEGDETLNVIDMVCTMIAQFVGAILGAIIYCLVTDAPVMVIENVPVAEDRWRPLLCFIFFHGIFYQVVASYKTKNNSLEKSVGFAFAYASIAVAFQVFAKGAFGGINLDLGRQFGSKMVHSEMSGDNLKDTWWILLLGPIGGVLQAKAMLMLEAVFDGSRAAAQVEESNAADAGDAKAKGDLEEGANAVPIGDLPN